jgi:hypothetical protein
LLTALAVFACLPIAEADDKPNKGAKVNKITYELYDAFQKVELDRWDQVIEKNVKINSPAGYGMQGLQMLKDWASGFVNLAYRIDLVDENLSLNEQGEGRGFITFVLHWKHSKDFFGLKPTGREGTSVETMLLTIKKSRVVQIDVADNTLDLVLYLWDRGWPHPHNIQPKAIVTGVDRG